jgi:RNA polymerase sigma-70 factor (ECF subfamily)
MTLDTDEQLINQTLQGDHHAADRLMRRYRPLAYATAYRALENADDAADVAQEALIYALHRLDDLRDAARIAGWLRNITLSASADYRRRRGTRRMGEPIHLMTEVAEETDFAERLALKQALSGLSEEQRTTLWMRYAGGWSIEEVAELMSTPVNTVRSRVMAAKRRLRAELLPEFTRREPMSQRITVLTETHRMLLTVAYPEARILSTLENPEPWQPFSPRVELETTDGTAIAVDFRSDITPDRVTLLGVLQSFGIPVPRILHGPVADGNGGYLTLCQKAAGENLTLWTLGGTPHRFHVATERVMAAIDLMQGVTARLQEHPVGATLARRTLADEAATLSSADLWQAHPWLSASTHSQDAWRGDDWFKSAAKRLQQAARDINDPLVYTDHAHFFPNSYRIFPGEGMYDTPLGWPGDTRLTDNRLAQVTSPWGELGDPLLGLAMVWIYDCYPFVHTGLVEQFLWRRGVSKRDFAVRLGIRALQTLAREVAYSDAGGEGYPQALRGYVDLALEWM